MVKQLPILCKTLIITMSCLKNKSASALVSSLGVFPSSQNDEITSVGRKFKLGEQIAPANLSLTSFISVGQL